MCSYEQAGAVKEGGLLKDPWQFCFYQNMCLNSQNTLHKDICFVVSCKWEVCLYLVMEKLLTCEV